ncbi:MAG TPA: terminase small subunit [Burkholderiales bacterium]|nr:terminase small subunit [Burkholderiales bacterium]
MTDTLTDRQERFVFEYLLDQNATAAAVRAGYSPKTRGAQAATLMADSAVRQRIVFELRELYASLGVTTFHLLQARARMAYFDPAKLLDAEGKPRPIHELDEDTRGALTVSYDLRSNGDYTVHLRAPVRHVALAALEKQHERFMELEREAIAALRGLHEEPEGEETDEEQGASAAAQAASRHAPQPAAEPIPLHRRAASLFLGRPLVPHSAGDPSRRTMNG